MKTISDIQLDNLIEANTRHDLNGNCYPVFQALTELKALRHPAPCVWKHDNDGNWYVPCRDERVESNYQLEPDNHDAQDFSFCPYCGHPIEVKAKVDADIATHAQAPESCGNCIGRFDSSKCRPAVTEGVCANRDEYRPAKVPDAEPWDSLMDYTNNSLKLAIHQLQQRFDSLQREMREGK